MATVTFEICVFGYDTVRHNTPFVVVFTQQKRMIENKAQHATDQEGITLRKALLAQRQELITKGINYTLNGTLYCEHAFDPQQLFDAYGFYIDNYDAWQAAMRTDDIKQASYAIGQQQNLLPAHAIQEMCTLQHEFSLKDTFKEERLDRSFEFYNTATHKTEKVYPFK
jgi:hypothetical protein